MSGTPPLAHGAPSNAPPAPPARRSYRDSPNRRRVVGRTVMWMLIVGGAAVWIPHAFL